MGPFLNLSRPALHGLALTVLLALPAGAALAVGGVGDIVFDPSNYAQAIKQVQAWEQQYSQMTQSITKAEATFQKIKTQVDALTGVRGFGDVVDNPLLKVILPGDLSTTLADLNKTGALSGNALSIRQSTKVYDCADLTEATAKTTCLALLGQTAQTQAFQQDTLALLNQRTTQIEALRSEINATEDPKGIAELQARLAAEQAQVDNDQTKIALASAMLEANRAAAAQAEVERVNALMATNKTSVLDGFSFTGLSYQTATADD